MSAAYLLILIGAVVAGYWVIRSIMEPGIDVSEDEGRVEPRAMRRPAGGGNPANRAAPRRTDSDVHEWHIELDVPHDASRAEIREAVRRRLSRAHDTGDMAAVKRVLRAARDSVRRAR